MRTCLPLLALLVAGCDLSLTHEPEDYDALDAAERAAADRIFARLQAYDAYLQAVSGGRHALGPIATDRNRVDVSAHDLWVVVNIGDDRIHISVWENLTSDQRTRFASWFGESLDAAAARYAVFFYDFMAVHLAGVQTVYAIQGVDWVYSNRHVFNVERDAERMGVNYLQETDPALFNYVWSTCGSIRPVGDPRWGSSYNQEFYGDNLRELTDPHDPLGYLYFVCRHMEQAELRRQMYSSSFAAEMEVLEVYRTGEY